MMASYSFKSIRKPLMAAALLAGVWIRLVNITANDFVFYDEGMYLGFNRPFLSLVAANPPQNLHELGIILGLMFKAALSTPKALWFFLLNVRTFLTGPEGYYFARLISAMAGLLTVGLAFVWAHRYFKSLPIALLSAGILLFLPSHVFYSRLGMQESLSTLFFLSGLYLYVFSPRGLNAKTIAAGVFLSAVFFTNYRMIIAPVFVLATQMHLDLLARRKPDWVKMMCFLAVYGGVVFGIGSLFGGANTAATVQWMLHQADEAQSHRQFVNFLSFPYYLLRLEHPLFAIFFFGNLYFVWQRQWANLLPFGLAFMQMFLFSFAAEKGARYLCVVLPFEAMAVAYCILHLKDAYPRYSILAMVATAVMLVGLAWQSQVLSRAHSDYRQAIGMVLAHDPQAKIMATQPEVLSLYVADAGTVVALPKDPAAFAALVHQGYHFLIMDPQVYVSWTADGSRFSPRLIPYVQLIQDKMTPVAVLPHLSGALLPRFVLDHNQDLPNSIAFLKEQDKKGTIAIYDLRP